MDQYDVLVVGAGPVGLFMASELSRHGLKIKIIDKKSGLSTQSKALGIHIRTQEVFAATGFIDEILSQGHPVKGALLKSGTETLLHSSFECVDAPYHQLIDLPQDETEKILEAGLLKKGLSVQWQTELLKISENLSAPVTAEINTPTGITQITAEWIIACDGPHSTLRHLLNMEFRGAAYPQNYWLADLHIDWKMPADQMVVYLLKGGPMACFPMRNGRYRLVMLAPAEGPEHPELQDIQAEFSRYCPETARLRDPKWLTGFHIHHRQINQYRNQRVFFAGDAAHIHSPMGGQGLNTGIQDAYNLAWKLALVQRGMGRPTLLDSYHLERHPVGKKVLRETDRMTRMVTLKNPIAIFLRNRLLKFFNSIQAIKSGMMVNLAELNVAYPKSPIVMSQGKLNLRSGSLIPNLSLRDLAKNNTENLFEITQGTSHHLFILGSPAQSELDRVQTQLKNLKEAMRLHWVRPDGALSVPENWTGQLWQDPLQTWHRRLGVKNSAIILVRPDQYVGYVQADLSPDSLDHFFKYLAQIFVIDSQSGFS